MDLSKRCGGTFLSAQFSHGLSDSASGCHGCVQLKLLFFTVAKNPITGMLGEMYCRVLRSAFQLQPATFDQLTWNGERRDEAKHCIRLALVLIRLIFISCYPRISAFSKSFQYVALFLLSTSHLPFSITKCIVPESNKLFQFNPPVRRSDSTIIVVRSISFKPPMK